MVLKIPDKARVERNAVGMGVNDEHVAAAADPVLLDHLKGHNYIGHTYIGHNYIAAADPVLLGHLACSLYRLQLYRP